MDQMRLGEPVQFQAVVREIVVLEYVLHIHPGTYTASYLLCGHVLMLCSEHKMKNSADGSMLEPV